MEFFPLHCTTQQNLQGKIGEIFKIQNWCWFIARVVLLVGVSVKKWLP
jgi:hypothetical protein